MDHRDEADYGKSSADPVIVEANQQLTALGSTILELRVIQSRMKGSTIAKKSVIKSAVEEFEALSELSAEDHMRPTIYATLQSLRPNPKEKQTSTNGAASAAGSGSEKGATPAPSEKRSRRRTATS